MPPVSVCHQVSTIGHLLLPITRWYHSQASGLMGSPTEPSSFRLSRLVPLMQDSPSAIRARIAVGAVYRMLTWCLSTTCRSEEHTSELQSRPHLVCRLLLE